MWARGAAVLRARVVSTGRAQGLLALGARALGEGDEFGDLEAVALEARALHRVVGDQSHLAHAEIHEDLHPDAVVGKPEGLDCVLEIVIDGLDAAAVEEAMRRGVRAAAEAGAAQISAGNYGGKLGQFHFGLHGLLGEAA